jgi:phage terminase large subunit GpA-like protein
MTQAPPPDRRYPLGYEAMRAALADARRKNLRPPPKLTLSEWSAAHAMLSPETSAQTGRFEAFGYQPGIMDAITDPANEQVVVKKSARVGFTKILDNAVGYYLHQDPSPILVVQPRVEDAEDYSSTEIAPMLRDTPVLAEITGDLKAKDGSQKLLKRVFRNGSSVTFVGANSPGGFRRITVRVIIFDEVDGYPVSGAGHGGDQISLGIRRGETFWNRRIVLGSTPTKKGLSRIGKAFEDTDQRRFFVECPHCRERQVLEWGGKDTPYGIKWAKDANGKGLPETAYYACRHNGCVIEEADKPAMIAGGEWRATRPFSGKAGFHIWTGYSLHVNASWSKLVAEWLEKKSDPLERQTFINEVLGEEYEDLGQDALSERTLATQTEQWAAEVPDGVAVLTAGIDVQDDRVEIEVVGWGRNEESWSIAHEVIEGDPDTTMLWDSVDAYLKRIWRRGDGRGFEVMATCVDSGGHHTQRVYTFSRERLGRRIWAIKGESARGGARSPVWPTKRPSARNKATFRPIIIGVNAAKDVIRTRLHLKVPPLGEASPGFMHFPADRDINYFAQILAERSTLKTIGGKSYRVWEQLPGRANEALDMRVYAYAALQGLLNAGLKLNQRVDEVSKPPRPSEMAPTIAPIAEPSTGEAPLSPVPPDPAANRRRSIVSRLA